jgi:hypothetical protein
MGTAAHAPPKEAPMALSEAEQRIMDGSAWNDFCEALKRAGRSVLRPETPANPFDRAEGIRYLTRLTRAALEAQVESKDPRYPRFFQLANETIKIGNDNPDNCYLNANVSGRYEYRIRGHRGTIPYLSIGTKGGGYETTGGMEPTGQVDLKDLDVDADGTFEVIVSCDPQPGRNWLPMEPHTTQLIVRQTFGDRSKEEPASLQIECLNPDGPDGLDPEALEGQLQAAAGFVGATANLFVDWMDRYSGHINQLPSDDQERCQAAGGDAAIHYLQSYWELGPDEALVIEARTIPECQTWNFQLSNFWMESLDYRYHRISVNKQTAHYEDDGSVRIVVAHRSPGPAWPNWLETCGHSRGGMLFRWVDAASHPPVETRVVKFDEL